MSRSDMIDPMNPTSASTGGDGPRVALSSMRDPGLLVALALLWVGSAVALSIDVPRTGFGIKGDEATYVAMALSVAYDGDLVIADSQTSGFEGACQKFQEEVKKRVAAK